MYATAKNNTRRYNSPKRHNGRNGAAAKTPFCKVCFDAGRPKEEYQSHYVKDRPGPHGNVVCPLLLNQECNYCHEKGHTPKQCPHIAARNARYAERQLQLKQQARAPDEDGFCCAKATSGRRGCASKSRATHMTQHQVQHFTPKKSAFAALMSGSDSEEEDQTPEEFPTIGNAPTKSAPVTTGWAAVAAAAPKPKPVEVKHMVVVQQAKPEVEQDNSAWSDEDQQDQQDHAAQAAFWAKETAKYAGKSWADSDWDDSDDEDDDTW